MKAGVRISSTKVSFWYRKCVINKLLTPVVGSISEELRDGEVTARQACYLPNVEGRGGGPIVGEMAVKGLFMGAGQ
jgi:hypothetical protein